MAAPAPSEANATTAGGQQSVLAADANRQSVLIQNLSDTAMRFSFIQTANAAVGWTLAAGDSRVMYRRDWPEIVNPLTLYCASGSKEYLIGVDV